jgi:hypothetical protein
MSTCRTPERSILDLLIDDTRNAALRNCGEESTIRGQRAANAQKVWNHYPH